MRMPPSGCRAANVVTSSIDRRLLRRQPWTRPCAQAPPQGTISTLPSNRSFSHAALSGAV